MSFIRASIPSGTFGAGGNVRMSVVAGASTA